MNNYSVGNLLQKYSIKRLFNIFENESKEVRLVGGCIRDALLGKETKDIDVAAKVQPDEIIRILDKHKIQYENFAYKYGSIIAIIEDQKFQITTLREDINQMGRHTNIIFTDDWKKDAERRDFTINAMYLSNDGTIVAIGATIDRAGRNVTASTEPGTVSVYQYVNNVWVQLGPTVRNVLVENWGLVKKSGHKYILSALNKQDSSELSFWIKKDILSFQNLIVK